MAPPAKRRTGHSRKAQYSIFTGYVLAAAGVVVGAALLGFSYLSPHGFAGLRGVATDLLVPAGTTAATGRTGRQGLSASVMAYIDAGSKNVQLREEIAVARVRLAEARAIEAENKQLKAILGMQDEAAPPVAITRLIGSTATSTRRLAYINKGQRHGIRTGMPIVTPQGLIGRVLETGSSSATILLLTDSNSMVPVRRADDDIVAFAEGQADGTLLIRLVNLGINPLKEGDVFVTTGAGGLFRPGIAVAVATKITRDGAVAHVLADPLSVSHVVIEPVWQPEALALSGRAAATPPVAP